MRESRSVVSSVVVMVFRLRLLMPSSLVCSPSARSNSASSCTSTSTSISSAARQILQIARLRILKGGHDQQNAIRPHRPALIHLPGIEDEIFAQDGQIHGRARRFQMLGLALRNIFRRSEPKGKPPRPPHRPRANAAGSKSSRISPPEGEAFLISVISPGRPRRRHPSAHGQSPVAFPRRGRAA